jgi:carbamoylphosphate synthase small subunit
MRPLGGSHTCEELMHEKLRFWKLINCPCLVTCHKIKQEDTFLIVENGRCLRAEGYCKVPDGEIMGSMHVRFPVFGIQFHPESILTPEGKKVLKNFLDIRK